MIYAGYHNAIDFTKEGPLPGALHDRQIKFVQEQARDVAWTATHGLAGTVWIDSSLVPDHCATYRFWKPIIIGLLANIFHKAGAFLTRARLCGIIVTYRNLLTGITRDFSPPTLSVQAAEAQDARLVPPTALAMALSLLNRPPDALMSLEDWRALFADNTSVMKDFLAVSTAISGAGNTFEVCFYLCPKWTRTFSCRND
jgi:hypothetical protein